MPRVSKSAPTVESVLADAVALMETEKKASSTAPATAPATATKPRIRKTAPTAGSAPVKAEKSVKAVKPVKTEAPILSAPAEPAKKKTFKPLTAELKSQLAEHAKTDGVTKSQVLSMKSHLMLGKTWEEAQSLAVAKAQKATATQ
jgi:hypothetical protein